jgi:hypothetical protein
VRRRHHRARSGSQRQPVYGLVLSGGLFGLAVGAEEAVEEE